MSRSPDEQVIHFLSDLYSVELQALAQLKTAPKSAEDPAFADDLWRHYEETEGQADAVRARLEALGGKPSAIKDAIMKLGGKGFLLFANMQTETPGRLLAHAYSYEAMEWAGYAVLIRLAELTDDPATAGMARDIQAQERTMMERLEKHFDAAESLSHRDTPVEKLKSHLCKHVAEAHAIESQSLKLLEEGADRADGPELQEIYQGHREETQAQLEALGARLEALGGDTSLIEDASLKLGGLNWSLFFKAQADTPAKFAAFTYAVEHLEIASYELLMRTARRFNDAETQTLCQRSLTQERAMTVRLAGAMDHSVRLTLQALRQ